MIDFFADSSYNHAPRQKLGNKKRQLRPETFTEGGSVTSNSLLKNVGKIARCGVATQAGRQERRGEA